MKKNRPKVSDLKAPTTNSVGRKARPYDGQVNPFDRGGVYLPAIVRLRLTQARRAGPRPRIGEQEDRMFSQSGLIRQTISSC